MKLIYDMLSVDCPDKHPQLVVKDLGITYDRCECWSIRDVWVFYGCLANTESLPSYIKVSEG